MSINQLSFLTMRFDLGQLFLDGDPFDFVGRLEPLR